MKHLRARKCQKASYPCNVKYSLLQSMFIIQGAVSELASCLMKQTFNGTLKPVGFLH